MRKLDIEAADNGATLGLSLLILTNTPIPDAVYAMRITLYMLWERYTVTDYTLGDTPVSRPQWDYETRGIEP